MADTYDLRRHMRFDTVVEGAHWDEEAQEWEVRVAGGERLRATYLITATGFLSQPKLPDIEGVGDFAGTVRAHREVGRLGRARRQAGRRSSAPARPPSS